VLRTSFPTIAGRPVQQIGPAAEFDVSVVELEHLPDGEREAEVGRLTAEEADRPFDLARGPVVRARILRLGENDNVLLLTMHHIVSDGWSVRVLINEVTSLYEAFSTVRPSPLPELPIQYADYAQWQRECLQGKVLEEQLRYWKNQLAGLPVLELPTDRPRPVTQRYLGERQSFRLSKSGTESLKELSQREGVTLFMTLLASLKVLLHRLTNQNDIAVGTTIANRNRAETEALIGFFVNQLVLRTNLSGDPTFRELLGRVKGVALDAYAHEDLPFDTLVAALMPERDLSRSPLFQVKIDLDVTTMPASQLSNLTVTSLETREQVSRHDLYLSISNSRENGLYGSLVYDKDLFDDVTAISLLKQYEVLLSAVVDHADKRLTTLEQMLAEADRRQRLATEEELQNAAINRLKSIERKMINIPD
jgi:hypothetical protein